MLPQYVYFGNAEFFFTNHDNIGDYLIVHRNNTLFFSHCDYNTLLNELLSAFDYFNSWESRMLEAASGGETVQVLLSLAEEVITNPAVVGTLTGELFAAGGRSSREDPYWNYSIRHQETHPAIYMDNYYDAESGELIEDLSETPRLVKNVYPGGAPVLMSYLKEKGEYVSCLGILQENTSLTEMNFQLVPFVARFLVKASEFTEPSGMARALPSIIQDLLDQKAVGENNLRIISRRLPKEPWRLVIFQHISRSDMVGRQSFLKHLIDRQQTELQWIYAGRLCAVIRKSVFNRSGIFSEYQSVFTIAVSMAMKGDASDLQICYEQALFALQASNGNPGIFRCEDYVLSWLLDQLRARRATGYLLHPALEILEQYDQACHADLRDTLHCYLKHGCVSATAAKDMHLHPNTMKYRLNKIRELTGLELRAEEDLRYLLLSDWLENE